jgi:hypothetical protein
MGKWYVLIATFAVGVSLTGSFNAAFARHGSDEGHHRYHRHHHPTGPVHGPGSSHNPIVYHPVHGPGSSHNPIVHHPVHGPGSSHDPIVCPKYGCYGGGYGGHH